MRPPARSLSEGRTSSRWRARKAGWKSSTTRSGKTAAQRHWCRSPAAFRFTAAASLRDRLALDYWTALHGRYERWINGFRHCPVLSLDVREYDLVGDPNAVEEIAAKVQVQLEGELPQTELWPPASRRRASA